MRLFVALDIPDDVRESIAALVMNLRGECRTARWARIEGLHITLKFIGEVPVEKTEAIQIALAGVPFAAPIKLSFHGLGFFPNEHRPRVLWAGIEAGADLGSLAAAVETALERLGVAREQRAFSPHLTLARFDSSKGLERLRTMVADAGPLEFGNAIAKEFHLYQSVLKRGGAEYTRRTTFRASEGESR
jgi:RNA 2',3'-cyclic 3'-phosphodiesterase